MKKILFITWDGPQTSYMEGLFMPIFQEISKQADYEFHVLQFTWAGDEKLETVKDAAKTMGVHYTSVKIKRKPVAILGALQTVYNGSKLIKKYIEKHTINIVMPRSTFPAMMVNQIKNLHACLIFDADGLPLEERVDFAGLSKDSLQYRFLKKQETKILRKADHVITRSAKAIEVHTKRTGLSPSKFSVVTNGRSEIFFQVEELKRQKLRNELGLKAGSMLFLYCGSLGPQYGWKEMGRIFKGFRTQVTEANFLILTGNSEFAQLHLPEELEPYTIIKRVPFSEVPNYLNAGDIAFAIRQPTFSMQGVAPIKIGEYVLMGLPTIASKGIGDTEKILKEIPHSFLFDHEDPNRVENAIKFAKNLKDVDRQAIRTAGLAYFSIQKSAESYCQAFAKL